MTYISVFVYDRERERQAERQIYHCSVSSLKLYLYTQVSLRYGDITIRLHWKTLNNYIVVQFNPFLPRNHHKTLCSLCSSTVILSHIVMQSEQTFSVSQLGEFVKLRCQ